MAESIDKNPHVETAIRTCVFPPIGLDTETMHLAMMSAAQRHGELVADLQAETAGLREA